MKVRVLHVIPNFGPGGAERLLVNLLEEFDRERFQVAAVSLIQKPRLFWSEKSEKRGLKYIILINIKAQICE